jgi:hypothetical protein
MKTERGYPPESFIFPGLLLAALILYLPALRVFFSLDDMRFLLRAAGLEESAIGIKRLLSVHLYFRAAWALFGTKAHLYHLVTIFLHALNAWLVYLIAGRMKLEAASSTAASALFLVSTTVFLPAHWISGIQEVSMAFFALLAAYLYLGSGGLTAALSLTAASLSILCKEASLLTLPVLAIAVPVQRRRRLALGIGGLLLGTLYLAVSGSLEPRPPGDPYESAFGANIVLNLLTYSAWIVRVWDWFPDRIPQYRSGLAAWGMIFPVLLVAIAWRSPKTRRSLGMASLIFIATILPVLGLVRHSYLYYLYLPMVPFWILAGAYIGGRSSRRLALSIIAAAAVWSAVAGALRRGSEIREGVPADPVLRYAAIARRGVSSLASSGHVPEGEMLFVRSFEGDRIDLAEGLEGRTGNELRRVHLFRIALLDGEALRLFFPRIDSVRFEGPTAAVPGWDGMHFYGTYGLAETIYLGFGEEGRRRLISDSMAAGMYERAARETDIALAHRPDRPSLLFLKGQIAIKRGDTSGLEDALDRLRSIAAGGVRDGGTSGFIDRLERLSREGSLP